MIAATNSWLLAFDNLSRLPDWLSNALCRLSTGGGLSKRELYTDSEETLFDAKRPIILTGIDRVASRHDLIDRSIIVTLPVIPGDKRLEERTFCREFVAAQPRILGALCSAASVALGISESFRLCLDRLPRMADFAVWAAAAAVALPWGPGNFMEAYEKHDKEAVQLALDNDVVACALRQFMEDKVVWIRTPTELLEDLKGIVTEDTQRLRAWPKAANQLTLQLHLMRAFLRKVGITFEEGKSSGSGSVREVSIRNGV
jgi:hypothetical protein